MTPFDGPERTGVVFPAGRIINHGLDGGFPRFEDFFQNLKRSICSGANRECCMGISNAFGARSVIGSRPVRESSMFFSTAVMSTCAIVHGRRPVASVRCSQSS